MFVAISQFVVANGMEDQVNEAFCKRPHLVDQAEGFVRMEVLNPVDNPEEFMLITCWENEQCWKQWYHSHQYKTAHQGIPQGLKLVPKSTQVRYYNLFAK